MVNNVSGNYVIYMYINSGSNGDSGLCGEFMWMKATNIQDLVS